MKRQLLIATLLGGMIVSLKAQNTPPIVLCPTNPITVECSGTNGTPVTLTTLVSDAQTNALMVTWSVDGTAYQTNDLAAGTTAVEVPVSFGAVFGTGTHEVLISVTDGQSDPVICSNTVDVVDTTPPEIQSLSARPNVLWPPNHKMQAVCLDLVAIDTCGSVTCRVVSVTSNEPENGVGDGNTWGDWALVPGKMKVHLRAERSGRGQGRTYTVTVECADAAGNVSTESVDVFVPHDRGQKAGHPKPKPSKPVKQTKPGKPQKKGKGPK
jgi:hypothetical protein